MYCNSFACCFSSMLSRFFFYTLLTHKGVAFPRHPVPAAQIHSWWNRHARMTPAGPQYCCSYGFLIWTSHGFGFGVGLMLWWGSGLGLRLRVKYPTAPRTMGQWRACQGDPGRASILLLLHPSDLNQPWCWDWGWARVSVRVKRIKDPTGPRTLVLEWACQGDSPKVTLCVRFYYLE